MSDQTAGPLEFRQRYSDEIEARQTHMDARQADMHTALPGRIVSYDATKMTAVVQPAIQAIQEKLDRSFQPIDITPISDVPVHFPGGGGHIMTFPVKAGDDCLIIFSERSIDSWFQQGAGHPPFDWRMHDINDAFVLVGVRSQPGVPGSVSPNTVQLRSDDGRTVVQVDGTNNAITTSCGGTTLVIDGTHNTVTITAATITMNGDLHVNGQVWAEYNSNPVSVQAHHHQNANAGQPPQVGT